MTNRRANYPPQPRNQHEVRKTQPFALHRKPLSEAVRLAFKPDRYVAPSQHPALPPAPWPWSWYEDALRWLRRAANRAKRLFL